MEGIANVAHQQQTQGSASHSASVKAKEAQPVKQDVVKEIQKEVSRPDAKINSQKDVQDLVEKLNKAMQPMSTSLSFAVDLDDIFYVSVNDSITDKMIRRFPAEKAADFLPKMQEVTGILFDSLG